MNHFPTVLLLTTGLGLFACGGAEPKAGGSGSKSSCARLEPLLRNALGPEFSAVTSKTPVFRAGKKDDATPTEIGCLGLYSVIPEELPEEDLPADDLSGSGIDQRLAVVLIDAKGKPALHMVEPAPDAPGALAMEVELKDVTGDAVTELVVTESSIGAEGYRGLRFFALAVGDLGPQELLTEPLKMKTVEGIELFAEWRVAAGPSGQTLDLEAAGTHRIFNWDAAQTRFVFDESATAAINPKPPAPESGAAPESAPAVPSAPDTPKKGKKGKKAGSTPIELP